MNINYIGTASESTIVALLAARSRIFKEKKAEDPTMTLGRLLDQLVVYCSDQAHSSVDKAALIVGCRLRKIVSDPDCVMCGEQVEAAIVEDRAQGLIPFFIVATLGTTPTVNIHHINSSTVFFLLNYYSVLSMIWLLLDVYVKKNIYGCILMQLMLEMLLFVLNIVIY